MVEKLTLNYLATALVDNPAVSMLPQLETSVALCLTTAHFISLLFSPAQGEPV